MANVLRRAKSSRPDALALAVSLTAGGSGLSRRGMACLLKLRRSQLELRARSQGALVRVRPAGSPALDLAACADSPLLGDYLSLLVLQLMADFPERAAPLRAILYARRDGLDVTRAARALWHADGEARLAEIAAQARLQPRLLALVLWAAMKPLCEAVAAAWLRHSDPPSGGVACPVCGGPAWAVHGQRARCAQCETSWVSEFTVRAARPLRGICTETRETVFVLDARLFETAFDPRAMIELVHLLEPTR